MIRNRWGLWVLLGLLSAMLVLALPSVAGAAAWGPGFSVSGPEDQARAGDPAVVIDAEGNATYVWGQSVRGIVENRMVLRSRVYNADGTIGPIESITTTATPGVSNEAKVGIDGSGRVHVAWSQERKSCSPSCTSSYKIMTVSLGGNGAPIGAPLIIKEYPTFGEASVSGLSYAVNSAGAAAAAFNRGPGTSSVMVFSVSAAGTVANISPTGQTKEILEDELEVAINSSGAVFATWLASEVSGRVIEGALGGASPGAAKLLSNETFSAEFPSLQALIDGSGNGTAIFGIYDGNASARRVFAARLNAGNTTAPLAEVSGAPTAESEFVNGGAAMEPDGSILVAWGREHEDSLITNLSPTGTVVGAPVELTPGAALKGWSPRLGLSPAGEGVVLLESGGEPVFLLREGPIAAGGVPSGPLVTLAEAGPDPPPFEHESPFESGQLPGSEGGRVAVSASGNAAVAWTVRDRAHEATEMRGSFRDGIAPAVSLSVPATAQAGEAVVMAAPGTDANPITYAWSFGDGSTGTGSVVSHAFAAAGTYTVSVTATDSAGNSTSRQASIQVLAPASGSGGGSSTSGTGGNGGAVTVRPQTKILKAPPKQTRERTVEVRFLSSQAGSSFECGLDAAGWKPCRSPLKLKGLAPGAHRLRVRATNSAGLVEAGGPVVRFQVLRPKR